MVSERTFVGIAIVLICFTCGAAIAQDNIPADPAYHIRNEKQCAYQGGICTMKDDCPPGSLTAVKGLCPTQQRKGVECCYGIPLSAKSCKSRGGECMSESQCHKAPRTSGECPNKEEVCCVLLIR